MFNGTDVSGTAPAQQSEYEGIYTLVRTLASGDSFDDIKINVDIDSDFELTDIFGSWDQDFTINLYGSNGRPIASSQVHPANFVGTAQFPVPLLKSMTWPRGSQIRVALTNKYAGNNSIELCFRGIKHFNVG